MAKAGPKKASARAGELVHIKDLTPDPKNARVHTPRNVGMIVDALHRVGAARSIVIDENGVVLAGNATVEAAGEAGITKLQVVDAAGDAIVAVRRTGLSPEQKLALALYDNRAGELASWDPDVLAEARLAGVAESMFTTEELDAICAGSAAPEPPEDFKAYDGSIETGTCRCPRCGLEGELKHFQKDAATP